MSNTITKNIPTPTRTLTPIPPPEYLKDIPKLNCNNIDNVIQLSMNNVEEVSKELPNIIQNLKNIIEINKSEKNEANMQRINTNKQSIFINLRQNKTKNRKIILDYKSKLDVMYGILKGDNQQISKCFINLEGTQLQPTFKLAFKYYTKCSEICFKLIDFARDLLLLC